MKSLSGGVETVTYQRASEAEIQSKLKRKCQQILLERKEKDTAETRVLVTSCLV